jgi:hypothetical protein
MWKEGWIILFIGALFSILFIQSSLDKIFNWKSELEFNKQHFSKTFLKPTVPLMLGVLTCMELSSGLLSAAGVCFVLKAGGISISFYANLLCATTFIVLFLGQRIAKDYGGAQSLISYFIVSLIGIYFSYPG